MAKRKSSTPIIPSDIPGMLPFSSAIAISDDIPFEIETQDDARKVTALKRLSRNIPDYVALWRNFYPRMEKLDLNTLYDMHKGDETIKAGVGFIAVTASKMLGQYIHDKNYVQAFVRKDIVKLRGSWNKAIKSLVRSGIRFGVGLLEPCFRYDEIKNETHLRSLPEIDPRTIKFLIDRNPASDSNGEVLGVSQWPNTSSEKFVPASKLVRFSHDEEFGDPNGSSRLKACYKAFIIKETMMKAWALTLERIGTPLIWARTKNAKDKIKVGGVSMTRADYLTEVLTDIQNITGFVVEGEDEVNVIEAQRSVGDDFEKIENHMNRMIFRALNLPSLIWETSNVGSFALGKKQFEMHLDFMSELMQEIIPALIEAAIKPIIVANFGPQEDYGYFELNQFQVEDMAELAKVYFSMSQEGYLSSRLRKDMDFVRGVFNADPISDKEFEDMIAQKDKEFEAKNKPAPTPGLNPTSGPADAVKGADPKSPFPADKRSKKTPGARDGRPPAS